MSTTISWGFGSEISAGSGNTVELPAAILASSANVGKIKDTDTEKVYVALDSPRDYPELFTVRSESVNKVSRNPLRPLVFPTSAKGGQKITYKTEVVERFLDSDGNKYDNPMKITTTIEIGNGAFSAADSGQPMNAAHLSRAIGRHITRVVNYEKASGSTVWKATSAQPYLDSLLHGAAEYENVPVAK